jgi:alkylation response protein AidB-like acyl-CoA dehydrogenase
MGHQRAKDLDYHMAGKYMFLAVRTNPQEKPGHAGISMFIVPVAQRCTWLEPAADRGIAGRGRFWKMMRCYDEGTAISGHVKQRAFAANRCD